MPDRSSRRLTDLVQAALPVLRAHASDADASARFPVENLRVLRETGLLGLQPPHRLEHAADAGTASVGMRLTGSVPIWQVVGEPGGLRRIAVGSLAPVGYLAWSGCWLGAARGALGRLVTLIRSTDRPSSLNTRSDLFAERLARVRMDLELVSAYLRTVCDGVLACRAEGATLDVPAIHIHLGAAGTALP